MDIQQVLEIIEDLNINKCSYTTYDRNVQECARREILEGLARYYNVEYRPRLPESQIFPVAKTRTK